MQTFTGFEYLMIDVANRFGLDKAPWPKRVAWTKKAMAYGFPLPEDAKDSILYAKALQELTNVRKGQQSGHVVGMDANASGLQVLAALTGCQVTARNCGLIDTGEVPQIYGMVASIINAEMGTSYTAAECKPPVMTFFYGSRLVPISVFGEDTPELMAFYRALQQVAPGPYELMQDMMDSWQPYALEHSWSVLDGFHAKIRVTETVDAKIEVDELDHATFTHRIKLFRGTETGLSLPANITHYVDGYVVREMERRCNYSELGLWSALNIIDQQLHIRTWQNTILAKQPYVVPTLGLIENGFDHAKAKAMSTKLLLGLKSVIKTCLNRPSFYVLSVHDEFKCLPNYCDYMRMTYREIFAELARSTVIDDILSQIRGQTVQFNRFGDGEQLAQLIEQSEYMIS